jgi:hypothetical protein
MMKKYTAIMLASAVIFFIQSYSMDFVDQKKLCAEILSSSDLFIPGEDYLYIRQYEEQWARDYWRRQQLWFQQKILQLWSKRDCFEAAMREIKEKERQNKEKNNTDKKDRLDTLRCSSIAQQKQIKIYKTDKNAKRGMGRGKREEYRKAMFLGNR